MAQSLSTLSSIAGSDDWRQRARNALSWLREKYVRLRNYKITPENILREGTRANFPLAGRMYFYSYDPKTKNKLVHYDTFPLVIPIEKYSATKFLGINFHYLPYSLRTQLMNNVMEQVNIEEEKFELQYSDIKGANRFRTAIPCIHRYDLNNVRSNIILINPDEWATAIYLPVEQFKKQNKSAVWRNSRDIIGRL